MKTTLFVFICGLVGLTYGSKCYRVVANNVSNSEAQFIVKKHNDLRKLIANGQVSGQPRGINLKRMKYDNGLASAAQRIADTCVFAHKTVNDGRWQAVGQNLYISYATGGTTNKADWDGAIQGWFDEHTDYTFGACCQIGPKDTGHYTQIVWADTEYVGCGFTYFSPPGFWKYQKLYVCNYGPAGNYIGQVPYKVGESGCENLC